MPAFVAVVNELCCGVVLDDSVRGYCTEICEELAAENAPLEEYEESLIPLLEPFISDTDILKKLCATLAGQGSAASNENGNRDVPREEDDKLEVLVNPVTMSEMDSSRALESGKGSSSTCAAPAARKGKKGKGKADRKGGVVGAGGGAAGDPSAMVAEGMQAVDDLDALTQEWMKVKEEGGVWGGRSRGGRGVRKGIDLLDDVDVSNLSLSYGGKPLLQNAELKMFRGHRYGLVGNNGVGKSTLLRRIAMGSVPGFPRHLRVVYVDQELEGSDRTALEEILNESELHSLEARRAELEEMLDGGDTEDVAAVAEELAAVGGEIDDLLARDAEGDARRALKSVGFDRTLMEVPTKELSGGWRMRASLARAVFSRPDLLLLDEPCNHLDMEAVGWLEGWLVEPRDMICLIVSHDRAFLSAVATDIIEFAFQQLRTWTMDYSTYMEAKQQGAQTQANQADALERKRTHVQRSIDAMKQQSRKDEKKSAQVASRAKKLERMGNDKTADGKKWKVSTMGYRDGSLDQEFMHVRGANKKVSNMGKGGGGEASFVIKLKQPEGLTSGAVPLLQISGGVVGYGDRTVLSGVDLALRPGDRVALLGANGQGKSSLLRVLAGDLPLLSGTMQTHRNAVVKLYTQHSADALDLLSTPAQIMASMFPNEPSSKLAAALGSFGLEKKLWTRRVAQLSGGQRARVALAIATFEPSHILLLDEPTNHLDLHTIATLGDALASYTGVVVLVTHNRDLVASLGDAAQLWEVGGGGVARFPGSLDAYKARIREHAVAADDSFRLALPSAPKRPQAQGSFL